MTNATLVLNYLAPVSLCYNFSFLYYILFIHPGASIGVLEKDCLNFRITHPLAFQKKKSFGENFGKLSSKTSILEFLIQVHFQAFYNHSQNI